MSTRMSAKTRALQNLQRMREAAREIFRNLQQTARLSKDDESNRERAEMCTLNRERLLAILQQMQGELTDCVTELKSCTAHKERMDALHKDIDAREGALRTYGEGLAAAHTLLRDGLQAAGGRASGAVDMDVDEVVRYSHVVSYSSSAREGWEAGAPMVSSLPPHPHVGLMAQSRLFGAADRPDRNRKRKAEAEPLAQEAGDGGSGHRYIREWKHPLREGDEDAMGGSPAKSPSSPPKGARKSFDVHHMSLCAGPTGHTDGGEGSQHGQSTLRPPLTIPPKPAKWRPGDIITVASPEMSRPPVAPER